MPQSIKPLIDLADTDRDLQAFINLQRHLEQKIKTARSEVEQHHKLFVQKQKEVETLERERKEVQLKIETQEQLISRLEEQVPMIRNEKEFVTSKNQLEEARKSLGILEEQALELDIRKEDIDTGIETLQTKLDKSESEFQKEASKLLKEKEKAEKKIAKLQPRQARQLKKIPTRIQRFYERCLGSGITPPICPIENKSCGGCHMVLLPQLINELMAAPNSYQNCPYCSRVLYYPEVEEEAGET